MKYSYCIFLMVTIICGVITTSCFYDNQEELYPPESCLSENVSFNKEIVPILESLCYACHDLSNAPSLGDGLNLEGHFNFSNYAEEFSSKLIGSLNWDGGGSPMPKGGTKLDNCTISKIEVWINEGRVNN